MIRRIPYAVTILCLQIGNVHHRLCCRDAAERMSGANRKTWGAPAQLSVGLRHVVHCGDREELRPLRRLNVAKFAPQIRVAFCNMVWNTGSSSPGELEITLQHIRRRRLLLQRLGKVGRALAQFVQQPRVLDGDYGLGGKILHQFDLLVR